MRLRTEALNLAGQEGVALMKVLLYTALFLSLAAFASRTTRMELRISHNDLLHQQALAIANAGVNHAYALIKSNGRNDFTLELGNGGTGGAGSPLLNLGSLQSDEAGLSGLVSLAPALQGRQD